MRATLLLLLTVATSAHAWPVDWIHDVEAGREKFVKLPKLDWVEVEDPKLVQVEWMAATNELLISGLKPGRTHVLLGAEGRVAVWRVRVGGKPQLDDAAYTAAQTACPDFRPTPLEDVKLTVTVIDEKCRKALTTLFQTDAFEARHVELTFDKAVLQVQLKSLQEGFDKVAKGKVLARYVGAGLVLTGNVTVAEQRKVLWEVLRRALGRFALDEQLEVEQPPAGMALNASADAGSADAGATH